MEDSDEPLDLEEEVRGNHGTRRGLRWYSELDALIKMPMPEEDPEEEAEREVRRQATARMRAYRRSRGEEVAE